MPAETHQHGMSADAETISVLLCALLSDEDDVAEDTVLADLGVGAGNFGALGDAVGEELAERTVGPDIDSLELDSQMTVAEVAKTIAALLTRVSEMGRR